MFLGPGDGDVEKSPFLGSGRRRGGVGDRDQAVLESDESHGRHSRPLARWKVDSSTESASGSVSDPVPIAHGGGQPGQERSDGGARILDRMFVGQPGQHGRDAPLRPRPPTGRSGGTAGTAVGHGQIGECTAEGSIRRHGPQGLDHIAHRDTAAHRRTGTQSRPHSERDAGAFQGLRHRGEPGVRPGQDARCDQGRPGRCITRSHRAMALASSRHRRIR